MQRTRRPPPQIFSRREMLYVVFLVGLLFLILASMTRIRNPASWHWLIGGQQPSTRIDESPFVPPAAPAQTSKGNREQTSVADSDQPALRPQASATGAGSGQVNPLGLRQIEKCCQVDQHLLSSVRDRRPRSDEDREAVLQLLCVAATTAPQQLAACSRKDVFFSTLWHNPATYRGELVRVQGVLRRLEIEKENYADRNPYGIDVVYEAWLFPEDQVSNPMLVLFTELPPGLKPGLNLKENVAVDAYFLKIFAFWDQGGNYRGAPMFVGHKLMIHRVDSSRFDIQVVYFFAAIVAAFFLLALVFWWQSRRDQRLADELRQTAGPLPDLDPQANPVDTEALFAAVDQAGTEEAELNLDGQEDSGEGNSPRNSPEFPEETHGPQDASEAAPPPPGPGEKP